jgi:hypothetical protein
MINECQAAASSEQAANSECLAEEEGLELSRYGSRDLLARVGSLHSPYCKQSIYKYPHKQGILASTNWLCFVANVAFLVSSSSAMGDTPIRAK